MAKESPFLKPMMATIEKMRLSGVLDDIWRNYETFTTTTCGDPMVTLGFKQLRFPILVLVIGVGSCILIGLTEKLAGRMCKLNRKTSNIKVEEDRVITPDMIIGLNEKLEAIRTRNSTSPTQDSEPHRITPNMLIGLSEKLVGIRTRKSKISTIQIEECQNHCNVKGLLMNYFREEQKLNFEDQVEDLEVLNDEIENFMRFYAKQ